MHMATFGERPNPLNLIRLNRKINLKNVFHVFNIIKYVPHFTIIPFFLLEFHKSLVGELR